MALSLFSPISSLLNFGSSRREMDNNDTPVAKRRKTSSTRPHHLSSSHISSQPADHSGAPSALHFEQADPPTPRLKSPARLTPSLSPSPSAPRQVSGQRDANDHSPNSNNTNTTRRKHLTHTALELKRLEDTLPPRPHKHSSAGVNRAASSSTTRGHAALSSRRADDKRVLRSQDGLSKSRSSLNQFFPDFQDVLSGQDQAPGTHRCIILFTHQTQWSG